MPALTEMTRRARLAVVLIVAVGAALLHAAPADAAGLPRGSMGVASTLDPATFVRTVEARYAIAVQHVVAADVDRDGDVDILAATDCGVLLWVNDGAGRLTSAPPPDRRTPGLSDDPLGNTWRGHEGTDENTIQNDAPSPRAIVTRSAAPPLAVSTIAISRVSARPADMSRGPLASRAPPRSR